MAANAPKHIEDEELDDLEAIEGVEFVTREEWLEMLDKETRQAFDLSVDEFAVKFHKGEFRDHDRHAFAYYLGMMLPADCE